MTDNRVAIILVNWNSFDLTNDCIGSLNEIQYKKADIIVVDNGSHDHSADNLKKEHPNIILLRSDTNLGFTGGNNIGLQYSLDNGYEYSILLNNDTFVEKDFLDVLVDYMDKYPETGAIQSRIFLNHDRSLLWNGGSFYNQFLGLAYTTGYNKKSGPKYNYIKQVDWITGCTFMVRNSILKQTGLLAANLFIYFEDVDLSFRIKKLGYTLIYHPDSVIYHIAGMANRSKVKGKEGYLNPVVHYLAIRNRIWILKKHTRWLYVPGVFIYNLFYILSVMSYFAARLRFKKLKAALKAVKDGLNSSINYN
jgi:GT2 family glycosyltransferase